MALPALEIQRTLNASPETVFQALTQPEALKQWWCTPGFVFLKMTLDARAGGTFRFDVLQQGDDPANVCIVAGTFLEVDAPKKLVYTWSMKAPGIDEPDTQITVLLHQVDEHRTQLSLRHTGFTHQEAHALHELDWPIVLTNLEMLLQKSPAEIA